MPDRMENIAAGLQQRIGQIVSQYEVDIASLRAEATEQIGALQAEVERLNGLVEELREELDDAREQA